VLCYGHVRSVLLVNKRKFNVSSVVQYILFNIIIVLSFPDLVPVFKKSVTHLCMINNFFRLCLTRKEHKIESVFSHIEWSKNMHVTCVNSSRIWIASVTVLSYLIIVVTGPATNNSFAGAPYEFIMQPSFTSESNSYSILNQMCWNFPAVYG